jgi:hypothetical protein
MSPKSKSAEVFVISTECTTTYPDLGLELPAGVPVLIPSEHLERVLTMPGVVVAELANPETEA